MLCVSLSHRLKVGAAALSASLVFALAGTTGALAQDGPPAPGGPPGGGEGRPARQPDFPPFAEVSRDFTKVVSTADDQQSMYTVYTRERDQAMLIELPREYQRTRYMMAMTVASGEPFAGLQGPDLYFYWKRFDKRLALMEPQIGVRSTGDAESKVGVNRVFTDRVVLDVPIVCIGPGGGPVIDGDALLAGQVQRFFGGGGFGGGGASGANPSLATIKKAKAFPQNVELAFEMPTAGGVLKSFHYSISVIPDSTGYQPRVADERIGFFQTWFRDLGKFREDQKWVRYINRWHLEKADPKLQLSPPKEPIVFYVEHTVPVRYRRWVRDGALWWNKAFEKVGISDAIEVYIQDKSTGAHMDKDPEDVRYNFIRWVTNDIATAIGPSRTHPLTGQILDADVVLTDGWIRAFWREANEVIPEIATRGMNEEMLAWMERNPAWDPRLRLLPPAEREAALAERKARMASRGLARFGAPVAQDPSAAPHLGFASARDRRTSGINCMAAQGKAIDMSVMRLSLEVMGLLEQPEEGGDQAGKDEKKEEGKKDDGRKREPKPDLLDGIPEWFVGQALADLTAHEVGHTLGLRHNFKASGAYTLEQINSAEWKGKKPMTASVMDYNPVNINMNKELIQGDYNMRDIGAYDMWAIEYGYTFGDPKKVLERVAEPELQFSSDEDAGGIDASNRRYDFSANAIDYARQRMDLARFARARILDKFVKEGESWSKARRGYALSLGMHADAVTIMANWVGAARIYRDRKGDPNGRPPIDVVPAATQREALKFVVENAFRDEAFGLTPELLKHLTVDRFEDPGAGRGEPAWPVHDQIAGIQISAMSNLINPVRLRWLYDNEKRVPANTDAITLPEVMDVVVKEIWSEVFDGVKGGTARDPSITSLRRNLQRESLERLIDLTLPGNMMGEASKPISNLAVAKLREIREKIGDAKKGDPYTQAHLAEAAKRIDKALDAQYIYNQGDSFGGLSPFMFMGQERPGHGAPPAPGVDPSEPADGVFR
ncbi:MAG: zinc-dependent metalloprotease [Planctomycetaceae bacterium]|jgi:hypothetical protein|nr:zinc-dependent metalloprotease [Phycisphaerales bacterium]MCE2654272.1 zinc-dependent metalloprotease [Planctomycetaceae bacterium]